MKFEEILNIINKNNISEEFFGYNNYKTILERIIENPKLIKKMEEISDEYWEEVKQLGLIIHMDLLFKTNTGASEDIAARYVDVEGKGSVPLLVYQKRRNYH